VSETTYWRLHERYQLASRGGIEVKGLGRVETYFLVGKKTAAADIAPVLPLFVPADDTAGETAVTADGEGSDADVVLEPDP